MNMHILKEFLVVTIYILEKNSVKLEMRLLFFAHFQDFDVCSGGREKLLGKYFWPKLSSFIYEGRLQG